MAQYADLAALKTDIETDFGSDFVGYGNGGNPIPLDSDGYYKLLVVIKTGRKEVRYYQIGSGTLNTDEGSLPKEMKIDAFLNNAKTNIKSGITYDGETHELDIVTSLTYLEQNGTANVARVSGYKNDTSPISAKSFAVWNAGGWKARELSD